MIDVHILRLLFALGGFTYVQNYFWLENDTYIYLFIIAFKYYVIDFPIIMHYAVHTAAMQWYLAYRQSDPKKAMSL